MPPLVDLQTDLKSLRYGNDRLGAGMSEGSGQPYIRQPIPEGSINSGLGDEDFLLRGGSLTPGAISRDVSRITKMFTDLRSPNGILFTLKQESLSRSSVNIKATSNNRIGANSLPLNNGLYLPTSTLAQVAVNAAGGHLLKQGINPFFDTSEAAAKGNPGGILSFLTGNSLPLSNPIYFETRAFEERIDNKKRSRLIDYTRESIASNNSNPVLYSYSGGPGSVVGVGSTEIFLSTERTGINNPNIAGNATNSSKFFGTTVRPTTQQSTPQTFVNQILQFLTGGINANPMSQPAVALDGYYDYSVFKRSTPTWQGSKIFNGKSLSQIYQDIQTKTSLDVVANSQNYITNNVENSNDGKRISNNVFQAGSFVSNTAVVRGLGTTLDYQQLQDSISTHSDGGKDNEYSNPEVKQDFRTKTKSGKSAKSVSYTGDNTLEKRVNLGDPGTKNPNRDRSYSIGNGVALDKINWKALYKDSTVTSDSIKNDFVKFRIGVIDNDDPNLKTYIHFRALIDGMSDSYESDWSAQKFMGRAENFYNYQGFDRTFDLSWTVVAQSKQELMPMYKKLNYLASVTAPDYSPFGYMRGNLITLTIGGYLYEQPGIMTGITYTVPEEAPWEIAIGVTGGSDSSVKEMPHMIRVTGFSFKPIQKFVPNLQKNIYGTELEATTEGPVAVDGGTGDVLEYGKERYIALDNGFTNNYGLDNAAAIQRLKDKISQEAEESEEERIQSELEEFIADNEAAGL